MEHMQEAERRRLAAWQASLSCLPVRRDGGLASIDLNARTMLLEGTVRTLQEENERLRVLFNRDIRILRVELDAAKSIASAGNQQAAGRDRINPLHSLIESYSEETGLLLGQASQKVVNRQLLLQLQQITDRFATDIKYNMEVLISEVESDGTFGTSEAIPKINTAMSNEALFVRAALDKSRRLLGIPVDPPTLGNAFDPPSHEYWNAMVEERALCRSERWSMQNTSKGMALTATRLVEALAKMDGYLQQVGNALPPAPFSFNATSDKSVSFDIASLGPQTKTQLEINRLLGAEMQINLAPSALDDTLGQGVKLLRDQWASMSLQIQRCSDLAKLLQGAPVVMRDEDISNSLIMPLTFELSEAVKQVVEGANADGAKVVEETKRNDVESINVSLDGILRGAYKKATPLSRNGTGRQSRVVTQGFFSSELAGN
eukprot:GILJ01021242.1.p1 GENE.GILJ01021242.1~~GILJ01021242.1.p1  ORF type:complete len:432 (-),score=58.67 GILJ01021242.1:98-1393(-)